MDAIKVKLIGLSRGGGGNLQPDKTATPTEQTQIVQPDPGYDGLRQVTVDPIPDEYADVSGVDAGAGDVRVGKIIVGSDGETITGTMPPQKPEEVGHATPTEQAQTVTPTAGSVFSAVEVGAIPSEYADVSSVDATAADVRTGKTIVDAHGDTVTGVMEPQKPEQVKSATPTTSPQSVTPDTGYALSRVDVGAIPSEYADVSDVTATAGTVLTGSDFVDASGTLVHGSCDYDADTSDATATAGQIEAGATAYINGVKITGSMPVRTTDVEIDSLSPVPIPAGYYDGTVLAKLADPTEVDPAVIKKNEVILGQVGTFEGTDTLEQYFANTLTSVDDSSATTLLASFFEGKTALESASFANVATIPNRAFFGCTNLEQAVFPAATSIGVSAFQNCSSLEAANFPLVTSTGTAAFINCSAMTDANFPSLATIQGSTFFGCSNLVNTDFSSATFAGGYALRNCTSLVSLNFPKMQNFGDSRIVDGDTALVLIDFGEDLINIGSATLQYAYNLTTLVMRANSVPTLGSSSAFDSTPFASGGTGGTIYIPETLYNHLGDGTSLDYKAATNWSVIDAYGTITWAKIEGSQYEVTP